MKNHLLVKLLGAGLSIFIILLLIVPSLGILSTYAVRGLPLLICLVLGVVYKPTQSKKYPLLAKVFDGVVIALSIVTYGYIVVNSTTIIGRLGSANTADLVMAVAGSLVLLELARRWTPPVLIYVTLFFVAYTLYGYLIPSGILKVPRISFEQFLSYSMFSQEGILGVGVDVMVSLIYIFLLFSAMLRVTGIGDFLVDIAKAATGRFTGGPALAAVAGSALFGMVSGSPLAGAAAIGSITIPMMLNMGYTPFFAASVVAAATNGGQIMPPVLGSVAFFISEVTGTPYIQIVKYSIIPALIYFATAVFAVWLEAKRMGIKGLPASELPKISDVVKKGWYYALPLVLLVVLLVYGQTPQKAAFYSTLLAALIAIVKKVGAKKFFDVLVEAANSSVEIMILVAFCGIIVASIAITGLAPKAGALVTMLSGGNVVVALAVIAALAIILGLPLPPLPAFIVLYVISTKIVSYMGDLGIPAMAIYMFMFYYCAMAPLTPPVSPPAFVTAGIAGTEPFPVSWRAFFMAVGGFATPFLFTQHPQLLLLGNDIWPGILFPLLKAGLVIFAGGLLLVGWFAKDLAVWQRVLSLICMLIVVIYAQWWATLAAIALLILVVLAAVVKRNCNVREVDHQS